MLRHPEPLPSCRSTLTEPTVTPGPGTTLRRAQRPGRARLLGEVAGEDAAEEERRPVRADREADRQDEDRERREEDRQRHGRDGEQQDADRADGLGRREEERVL